jgi:hypothetical protein
MKNRFLEAVMARRDEEQLANIGTMRKYAQRTGRAARPPKQARDFRIDELERARRELRQSGYLYLVEAEQ